MKNDIAKKRFYLVCDKILNEHPYIAILLANLNAGVIDLASLSPRSRHGYYDDITVIDVQCVATTTVSYTSVSPNAFDNLTKEFGNVKEHNIVSFQIVLK